MFMQKFITLVVLFGFVAVPTFAQETMDDESTIVTEDGSEVQIEGDLDFVLTDGSVDAEDIENAEEITAEDIEEELIVGEVVAVTDEFIVLENENGELVKVSLTLANQAQRRRGAAVVSLTQLTFGNRVALLPANGEAIVGTSPTVVEDTVVIQTASGAVTLPLDGDFKIVAGGDEYDASVLLELDADDSVTVVTDENGEVLGIHITGEDTLATDTTETDEETDSGFPWGWVLLIVVVLVVLGLMMRKN